jgi:hypothetical protein
MSSLGLLMSDYSNVFSNDNDVTSQSFYMLTKLLVLLLIIMVFTVAAWTAFRRISSKVG